MFQCFNVYIGRNSILMPASLKVMTDAALIIMLHNHMLLFIWEDGMP